MNAIAAVVVTYNRLSLLKQNITALQNQTVPCDILIIDNASTDDTASAMQAVAATGNIQYYNTGSNLGGAGGFNFGMRCAVEAGYQYVWIMDDDCLPKPNALEALLSADSTLGGKEHYSFLSSAVLWTNGHGCAMNQQQISAQFHEHVELMCEGIIQVQHATFVSLLFPRETVLEFGLPIRDFFIWGDDIEYTQRVAQYGRLPAYLVGKSQVVHAMSSNTGSDIAVDSMARMNRYVLAYRNESYTYRKRGLKGRLYFFRRCLSSVRHIILFAPDHRLKRFCTLIHGIWLGFFFRPSIEFPKSSSLSSSSDSV